MTEQQGTPPDDVWTQNPASAPPPPPMPPVPPTAPSAQPYGTPQPYTTNEPYGTPQPYGVPQPYGTPQLYPSVPAGSSDKNWLGIVSLIAPFVGLAVLGIVFGQLGLKAVKRGQANNRGVALAGTILSWVFTGIGLLTLVLAVAMPIFLNQQDKALDAEAKSDLADINVAIATALVDSPMMPEVTLVGGDVRVGDQTVPLDSDPSAMSFVQNGESDYCIDLSYGRDQIMSLRQADFDTTYAPRGCPDWGFEPGDDAVASENPDAGDSDEGVVTPQAEAEEGTVTSALYVGDCFLDPTEGGDVNDDGTFNVSSYVVVPCDQPHYGEVYASANTTLTEYDLDAVMAEADNVCYTEFEAYVGISYDASALYADTYYPTSDSWIVGDREILCAISVETGDAVGSFAGSGQ